MEEKGGEERGRCEEEAADLISFSPSLIMASYCSNVGTACGLTETQKQTRKSNLSRNKMKINTMAHIILQAQWCVKLSVSLKVVYVLVINPDFNSHVNSGIFVPTSLEKHNKKATS